MQCLQLIFRKVSDLKREKELAEKRKNDPALNQSQDHLVRKLFSKFKKTNTSCDMSALVPLRDPERGDSSPVISRNNSVTTLSPPKLPEPTENGLNTTSSSNLTGNGKPPGGSGSILNVNKSTNKVNSELTTLSETSEKPQTQGRPRPALCNGPRGWGRLKAKTSGETQNSAPAPAPDPPTVPPAETEPPGELCPFSSSSATLKKAPLPSPAEPQAEPLCPMFSIPKLSISSDSEAVCPETTAAPVLPAQSPEYSQMMANLMDFKVSTTNYVL